MPYFLLYFVLFSCVSTASSKNPSATTQRGCDIQEIKLFLLSDSESELAVEDEKTYRIRVDEDILGDIAAVNWTIGNYEVAAYSLQQSCATQDVAVDVDKKSLLVVEASDHNTKHPFTATVLFGDSGGVRQFKVILRLDRPTKAEKVIGSIAVWAGIAGGVLILLALFVVVFRHVEKQNYKRQLAALELPPQMPIAETPTIVANLPSEAMVVYCEPLSPDPELLKAVTNETPIAPPTDQPTDATDCR